MCYFALCHFYRDETRWYSIPSNSGNICSIPVSDKFNNNSKTVTPSLVIFAARCYASAAYAVMRCPSVCHVRTLLRVSTYLQFFFSVGQPNHSIFYTKPHGHTLGWHHGMPLNSIGSSTLQCGRWFWDDMLWIWPKRFSQKLSNFELWSLLTTYRKSYIFFSKNPLLDP